MHGHMSRCTVTCHDARAHERDFIYFAGGTEKNHENIATIATNMAET